MEKILIVDDNEGLRRIIKLTLGSGRYQLIEAANGVEAIQLAESELPDFVLLDIMMPGMSGFEVCQKLRAIPTMAKTIIIILSALTQKKDQQRGLDMGADLYITKPFLPTELIKVLNKYADNA